MKKIILLVILLLPTSARAQILINEIAWMGTDVSASDEWIELYNYSDEEVDLNSWRLESADGSPVINLEGFIAGKSFFLLERTDDDSVLNISADQIYSGALSNTGENLTLYNQENNVVDAVNSAEGWLAGDNTTKQTMERVNLDLWATSLKPLGTPKETNSQPQNEEEEEPDDQVPPPPIADKGLTVAKRGDITITEVLANPAGVDLDQEFIEIQNFSGREINLTNWTIKNSTKQEFIIPSLKMSHGSIVVFYRSQTNLALDNTKEKITLYSDMGNIIDKVDYKDALENLSYQQDEEGNWHYLSPTPKEDNNIILYVKPVVKLNKLKEAEANTFVTFDASDSFDPDNRDLKFYWNFNNGYLSEGLIVKQFYENPGTYEFSLTAFVDKNSSTTEKFKIKIIGGEKTATTTSEETDETITFSQDFIPYIFISEFLPNPIGSDTENEFIEIFNNDQIPVNLVGWQLTDGAKTFTFSNEVIKPGQYLAMYRLQTKIALNNDEDEIKLITPSGDIIDLASYEGAKEGQSFVLDENFVWQKTTTPSPGEINVLDHEEVEEKNKPKILGVATEATIMKNEPKNKDKYFFAGLASVTVLGLGAILKIKKS